MGHDGRLTLTCGGILPLPLSARLPLLCVGMLAHNGVANPDFWRRWMAAADAAGVPLALVVYRNPGRPSVEAPGVRTVPELEVIATQWGDVSVVEPQLIMMITEHAAVAAAQASCPLGHTSLVSGSEVPTYAPCELYAYAYAGLAGARATGSLLVLGGSHFDRTNPPGAPRAHGTVDVADYTKYGIEYHACAVLCVTHAEWLRGQWHTWLRRPGWTEDVDDKVARPAGCGEPRAVDGPAELRERRTAAVLSQRVCAGDGTNALAVSRGQCAVDPHTN